MLASGSQWQTNKSLFNDMLDYASAHQYFTGSDTQNTLFLKVLTGQNNDVAFNGDVYALPVPNGWTAQLDNNSDIVIAPSAATQPGSSGPAMRLTFVGTTQNTESDVLGLSDMSARGSDPQHDSPYPTDTIQRVLNFYGLPGSPSDASITKVLQGCAIDPTSGASPKPTQFHNGGQTGWVILTNEYIVGAYAPDADFSKYQATLQKMMDAYVAGYTCGMGQTTDNSSAPNGTPEPTSCPNAPALQLSIGNEGIVTPGTPDNLRSAPNTQAVVLLSIPAGRTFIVLQGPVCDSAAGMAWWQVSYQSHTGWLAEGQGKTYFVTPFG